MRSFSFSDDPSGLVVLGLSVISVVFSLVLGLINNCVQAKHLSLSYISCPACLLKVTICAKYVYAKYEAVIFDIILTDNDELILGIW